MASWYVALLRSPPTMAPTFKLPIAHPAIQASKAADAKPAAVTRKKRSIFHRIKAWMTGPSCAAGTTSIRPTKVPCMPPIIVQLREPAAATAATAASRNAQSITCAAKAAEPPCMEPPHAQKQRLAAPVTSCADNKAEAHQTHRAARCMAPQLAAVAQPASTPSTSTKQPCGQKHFILYPPSDAPVVHTSAATPMQLPRTGLHPQPAPAVVPTPTVQLSCTAQPALPAACSTPQAAQAPVSWADLLLASPDSPCPSHLASPQLPAHTAPHTPQGPLTLWAMALLDSPESPLHVSPTRVAMPTDSPVQELQASTPCPSPSLSPAAQPQPQLLTQPPAIGSAHSTTPSPAEELQASLLADADYLLDFTEDVNLMLQALRLPPCSPSPAPSSPAQQAAMPSATSSPVQQVGTLSAASSPAAVLSATSSPAASSTWSESEVSPGNLAWRLSPFTVGPCTTAATPAAGPSFQWDLSPPNSSLHTPPRMRRSCDYDEANGDHHMLVPRPWYLSPFPTFDSPCRQPRTTRFQRAHEAIMAAAC